MLMRPLQPQTLDNLWLIYQSCPLSKFSCLKKIHLIYSQILFPIKKKEMEPKFKTPVLDDFLLSPVPGDQITDIILMHRYLPRQADVV